MATFTTKDTNNAALPTVTAQRVSDFQERLRLPKNGELDEDTQNKINDLLSKQQPPIKIKSIYDATAEDLSLLAMLINSMQDDQLAHPNTFTAAQDTTLSTLQAAFDILNFTSNSVITNSLEEKPTNEPSAADDRYFSQEIYKAGYNDEKIRELGYEGGRASLAGEALHRFRKQLSEQDISAADGAKAIMSGVVAPHPYDLALIFEGYGRPPPEEILEQLESSGRLEAFLKDGWIGDKKPGDTISPNDMQYIDDSFIGGILVPYRQARFTAEFGDLSTVIGVKTVIDGATDTFDTNDMKENPDNIRQHNGCVVPYILSDKENMRDYMKLRDKAFAGNANLDRSWLPQETLSRTFEQSAKQAEPEQPAVEAENGADAVAGVIPEVKTKTPAPTEQRTPAAVPAPGS